jgi:alpha-galactosidase
LLPPAFREKKKKKMMKSIALLLLLIATIALAYDNDMQHGLETAPMGWNTWCTQNFECSLPDYCNEREIREIADALHSSGMQSLGYRFVNLDDCWSAHRRDSNGQLMADAKRFPSGIKALTDYIHSLDLLFGIYTCVGDKTCRGDRPGSFGHYDDDAKTLAAWGVDYVKADNCHRKASVRESYGNFSRALNATGRPMLFAMCEWGQDSVQEWGASVAQMYRIQRDHLPVVK